MGATSATESVGDGATVTGGTAVAADPVGDFYVYMIEGRHEQESQMLPSGHFLRTANKPSVIHFYNGG